MVQDGFSELSSIEDLESALDDLAVHMNKKIRVLHTEDNMELESLEDNAKLRSSLKEKLQEHIKEQQKELSFASDAEGRLSGRYAGFACVDFLRPNKGRTSK